MASVVGPLWVPCDREGTGRRRRALLTKQPAQAGNRGLTTSLHARFLNRRVNDSDQRQPKAFIFCVRLRGRERTGKSTPTQLNLLGRAGHRHPAAPDRRSCGKSSSCRRRSHRQAPRPPSSTWPSRRRCTPGMARSGRTPRGPALQQRPLARVPGEGGGRDEGGARFCKTAHALQKIAADAR